MEMIFEKIDQLKISGADGVQACCWNILNRASRKRSKRGQFRQTVKVGIHVEKKCRVPLRGLLRRPQEKSANTYFRRVPWAGRSICTIQVKNALSSASMRPRWSRLMSTGFCKTGHTYAMLGQAKLQSDTIQCFLYLVKCTHVTGGLGGLKTLTKFHPLDKELFDDWIGSLKTVNFL